MSKKKLDTSAIISELRGESPFFPARHHEKQTTNAQEPKPREASDTAIPSNHDTTPPRHHDAVIPSNHDTTSPDKQDIHETVRKAVKQLGKEAATHRFTVEEKEQLAEIEYAYKRQGIRTSENEITRIALNYFLEDHRQHGENSLLAKILNRLNS